MWVSVLSKKSQGLQLRRTPGKGVKCKGAGGAGCIQFHTNVTPHFLVFRIVLENVMMSAKRVILENSIACLGSHSYRWQTFRLRRQRLLFLQPLPSDSDFNPTIGTDIVPGFHCGHADARGQCGTSFGSVHSSIIPKPSNWMPGELGGRKP